MRLPSPVVCRADLKPYLYYQNSDGTLTRYFLHAESTFRKWIGKDFPAEGEVV